MFKIEGDIKVQVYKLLLRKSQYDPNNFRSYDVVAFSNSVKALLEWYRSNRNLQKVFNPNLPDFNPESILHDYAPAELLEVCEDASTLMKNGGGIFDDAVSIESLIKLAKEVEYVESED